MSESRGILAPLRVIPRRLSLVAAVALYAGCFLAAYRFWLSPVFGYLGFIYQPVSIGYEAVGWGLCLLPCLWMPLDLDRPSMLIYWVLYLTVYVPSMFVPLYIAARPMGEVCLLLITMAVGMRILGWSYHIPLLPLRDRCVPPRLFWMLILAAALLLAFGVAVKFRGQMKLVSMDDIYGQRAEAKAALQGSFVGYFVTLLQGLIAPFFLAFGLFKRKWTLYAVGLGIQVLVYACTASKGALASAVFAIGFYAMLRRSRRSFGLSLAWGLAVFTALVAWASAIQPLSSRGVVFKAANILILRTIGSPGLVAGQYQGFFADHPHTHLSHVNGVNLVVPYPYHEPLGNLVGDYYTGNADLNANANMWITDGLASFGLPGILGISLLAALVFWLADSASRRHSPVFGAVALTYAAINLANVSLFTTLVSGGLLPLIIVLNFMPPVREGDPPTPGTDTVPDSSRTAT